MALSALIVRLAVHRKAGARQLCKALVKFSTNADKVKDLAIARCKALMADQALAVAPIYCHRRKEAAVAPAPLGLGLLATVAGLCN